ncbi:T7SS effector LXG polymorphic toxin [Bacillus wiedmannii]|uniref:T7SS effector LXG polymorphic toxin n=1 Tax=Bacillus wiedmannii TaxID=1890302 RepID=UPI000863F5E7|nr:T7SS effector LXG polymorphic toxin [Bacillus wiedmannii]MDI6675554.1 T7SS effector LXG polymorphic toxin [Bacillus wiedmannii]SCN08896.1 Cytoplasmic protein [Bacillus wiedmannii]
MSLNMYLGEVQSQTHSMNAVCSATIQGMEQAIQSIDAFTSDTVLQGQTYDSAKAFFAETFRPLAQGIIYLCEELIRQNDAFPNQFQSQVASTDVVEQELLEQIREIDRMIASTEALNQAMPISGMDAMVNLFIEMRRKIQEKLEHLYEFNQTSSNNYATALQLAASIATGLAEVQSGKGFSPASGTFSTKELNMEWVASIQAIAEDRNRQADNSIEEGAMCGKPKSDLEKAWDGLYDGAGKGVGDAWEGFKALGDGETWSDMWDAVVNYDETLPAMWNAFSDSFMDDVWHGDVESGFRWGSYLVTSVGLGFLGGKGLDKVSTLARGARFSKITQITPPRLQPVFAGVGLTGEAVLSTLPSSGNWGNYLSGYFMFARPHWRESEKHAYEKYPNYKDQVSFKDREEVPYASKGSTRPDGFDHDLNSSLEVKNYNLTTERGKRSLINVLLKQFEYRLKNLPEGAEQIAFIDARGQNVSVQTLKEIKEELSQRTFGKLKVTIERD